MTEEKNTSSSAPETEKDEKHEELKEDVSEETEEKPTAKAAEVKTEEAVKEQVEEVKDESATEAVEETKEETEEKLKDYSYLKPGMTVKVHQKITEAGKKKNETKTRIQIFEGMILAIKNTGISKTITVRKVSNGIGVEKIFPIQLPTIIDIEPVKQAKVRRSKLYYLRDRKKRLKERRVER